MGGALSDIRILDLSRVMAGPWCTQILADLGAEVIKVERPGAGDETRNWGPPWFTATTSKTKEAAYYLSANRGKHSLTIDIGNPEGQQLVKDLASQSDVFIENFKVGDLARKGLDYQTIKSLKPDIIYCSITGFGLTGPLSTDVGYDYLIQAMSGLMSITGVEDGRAGAGPQRVGVPISDMITGLYAVIAILAALQHRNKTGVGQEIDMALLDAQVGLLGNQALNYFLGENCPTRTGVQHPNLAPYQPFTTEDGAIIIAIGNDDQFQRFCRAVGCPDLANDEHYRTNPDRVKNRDNLINQLEAIIRTRTSLEWMKTLKNVSVPCGPINTIAKVFEEPQIKQRKMKIELDHAFGAKAPGVANPIKFSKTPIKYSKAPPILGEDTDTVLNRVLGIDKKECDLLRKRGVI